MGEAIHQKPYRQLSHGVNHDIIIRDERHWQAARKYIHTNPTRWHTDRLQAPANA